LDKEGTLLRALKSAEVLEDKNFQLVVLAVSTSSDIAKHVEEKVTGIIKSVGSTGVEMLVFGDTHLGKIHDLLHQDGQDDYVSLLELGGYSNVRNLCTFVTHILGADVAVLIDDDEVFEDPKFMHKAKEFIGKNNDGEVINAVAGYYLQPNGEYRVNKPFHPWMEHWDQIARMNEGFDRFIGSEPRLKKAPFVFGGNMIIHRNLFIKIPFDPNVPRGEDIDFLMNAKIFGFDFFLDNTLTIKHLPPPKTHPTWRQIREDIYRFIFERAKITNQKEIAGLTKVCAEDFDPYPGCFLKDDLEEKIRRASEILSNEYLSTSDQEGSKEALNNIKLAENDAPPEFDPFENLCQLQKRWQGLMEYTEENRSTIKEIIEMGQ
jgi:hypothetical protein